MPVFIPKTVEKSRLTKKYNMSTEGCFCSFSCAAKYNDIYNHNICENIKIDEHQNFNVKLSDHEPILAKLSL